MSAGRSGEQSSNKFGCNTFQHKNGEQDSMQFAMALNMIGSEVCQSWRNTSLHIASGVYLVKICQHNFVHKHLVCRLVSTSILPAVGKQEQSFHCHCGRSFDTIQGLTAHIRYKHNYIAPETTMVGAAVSCPHCLKYLWTPARVKQHLSYIPRGGGGNPCYNALLKAGYVVELDPHAEPPPGLGATRGINRRDALQASGPRLPPKDALQDAYDAARHEEEDFASCFAEAYDVQQLNLEMVERYSRAYTAATQQWFQEIDPEVDMTQAMIYLQDRWLEVVEMEDPEEEVTLITIYWGREILPEVTQSWEAGYAEQWAEQAL